MGQGGDLVKGSVWFQHTVGKQKTGTNQEGLGRLLAPEIETASWGFPEPARPGL